MADFNYQYGRCHCDKLFCAGCPFYEEFKYDVMKTRRCVFCGNLEEPRAKIVSGETWICLNCVKQIGKLIGVNTES